MHEYGLAHDVAERLKAEVRQAGARRIIAVDIEVGSLSHASAEHLAFWIKEALGEGPGRDAAVRVLRASSTLSCLDCGRRFSRPPLENDEWPPYSLPAPCLYCGSSRVRVEGETGCTIRHLELEC